MDLLAVEAPHFFGTVAGVARGLDTWLGSAVAGLLAPNPKPSLDEYLAILDERDRLDAAVTALFSDYDIRLCPTAPFVAPEHDQPPVEVDGKPMAPGHAAMITATLLRPRRPPSPVAALWGFTKPPAADPDLLGVQLLAAKMADGLLSKVAATLEAVVPEPMRLVSPRL
jgi:Asp-tRNA(Asn)/Glu-tRNA(Gln) amidotransferase A subunit family amidase